MNQIDINDRQTLQKIREMAEGMAAGNLHPLWVRAYVALADAADRIDFLHAHCTLAQAEGWAEGWAEGEPASVTKAAATVSEMEVVAAQLRAFYHSSRPRNTPIESRGSTFHLPVSGE